MEWLEPSALTLQNLAPTVPDIQWDLPARGLLPHRGDRRPRA
jgi:hypothetical protein